MPEPVWPPEGLCGAQEQQTTPSGLFLGLLLWATLPPGACFLSYPKTPPLDGSCQPLGLSKALFRVWPQTAFPVALSLHCCSQYLQQAGPRPSSPPAWNAQASTLHVSKSFSSFNTQLEPVSGTPHDLSLCQALRSLCLDSRDLGTLWRPY